MKSLFPEWLLGLPRRCLNLLRRIYFRLRRDYSQAGETIAVRKLLRDYPVKFFVEVGANDGRVVSTTFGLMRDGWAGLCIEPNPMVFERLQRNVARFRRVKAACYAASPTAGPVKLYLGKDDPEGVFSTLSTEDSEWYRAHRDERFVLAEAKPLSAILQETEVPANFALLLVDTEGMDLEVLQTLDFGRYRPHLIVTEDYLPKNSEKFAFLEGQGYQFLQRIGCNTFWMDSKLAGRVA